MSLDTTLITRNRVLAAALETTTGTPASLPAASCGLFNAIFDPKITLRQSANDRPGQQYLSPLPVSLNARSGQLSFRSELYGSGTAATEPSYATKCMAACGCAIAAGVVTPLTAQATNTLASATLGLYQAGRQKRIAGAMGNFKVTGKTGSPVYLEWAFEGAWMSPKSVAIPSAITYPTTIPPRFAGAAFTLGGQAMRVSQFEFDPGNKLYLREDPNAVDDASTPVLTGIRAAIVVDRKPMITIDPESLPLSTLDWFAGHAVGTTYSFTCQIGAVVGNIVTLAASAVQLYNPPEDEDRSGIMADKLQFICTGLADAEWSITFG